MILSPFCQGHTLKLKKIKSANFGGINGGWDAAWPHADAIQRAAPAGRHDRPSDAAADRPLPTPRHHGRSPTPPARPTHAITADRVAHSRAPAHVATFFILKKIVINSSICHENFDKKF